VSRDLVRAYLQGEVRALQPDDEPGAPPLSAAALARAVARARRPLAPEVHRALVAQNARLAASPARDAHLEALSRGAAAVVTGQQVGLFLGPLYTLYKAAAAVVLARALTERTGTPVVPVFWLQTEDHDLPEIASVAVPSGPRVATLAVPVDAANRIAIAHCPLPAEIAGCLDALGEAIAQGQGGRAPGEHAAEHLARLRRHYRPGAAWAEAFAGVLGELFAPEGLVLIDPREPALAQAVAPVHARALADAAPIAAALIANDAELARAGFAISVHVRPGAPLSFFHPEGPLGPRCRLEPVAGGDGERLVECGRTAVHSRGELAAALAADPMRFSTSALLRPIVQDTLLPTAAYVGGPGEVAYFAQLPPLYRAFDRALPPIVPRARFRIVDERARRLLDRLGLSADDAARPEAELLARLGAVGAPATGAEVTARLLAPFAAAHGELAAQLAGAGPELARALARTAGSVERAIGRLAGKVERAALYRDAARVDAVRRLRALLAPDGTPQERTHGLAGFAARAGDRAIVERVVAAIDPADPARWFTLRELA
jgi:bacillithiol synthase